MYIHTIQTRVRYADTDKMGYLYHGHLPAYYEIGRTEAIRNLGVSYKELEDSGIMMPVIDLQVKYIKPVYYDTLLTIKTIVSDLPIVRMKFRYEAYNEENTLVNIGETTLIFFDKVKQKPCRTPEILLSKLKPYFA